MKHCRLLTFVIALLVSGVVTCLASGNTVPVNDNIYLFSYFHDNGGPGDGLHLAWSEDALEWTALNGDKILFKPSIASVFRDPFIMRGPDGIFRMLWTTGWNGQTIGYAHSDDLLHWTDEKFIPVMEKIDGARNSWAPEMFYDDSKKQYMIFWSSTVFGRFQNTDSTGDDGYNHRIYYTTTSDFVNYAETKLLYDPGFNCIDATIIKDSDQYFMFLKNETLRPVKKHIIVATSDNAEGPYGRPSKPLTMSWVEGPTVAKIGSQWRLYYDNYTLNTYGLSVSNDLKHWTISSSKLHMPAGVRHGTVFSVPKDIFSKLPR